jgi:hypothetical protein
MRCGCEFKLIKMKTLDALISKNLQRKFFQILPGCRHVSKNIIIHVNAINQVTPIKCTYNVLLMLLKSNADQI